MFKCRLYLARKLAPFPIRRIVGTPQTQTVTVLQALVVAEGVETEEQSRTLRLLKCDEMQGYLFSKPVPSEIFETRFLAPVIVRDPLRGT